MQLFIDKADGTIIRDPLFKDPVSAVSFKRGDSAAVQLSFVSGNSIVPLASGAAISFGIKETGKYDGDFLVFADEFTSVSNSYFIGPSFNTESLNEALNVDGNDANDVASLNAMLEITWSEASGVWQSSNTITATIHNDVVKGSEGSPVEFPDAEEWLAARVGTYVEHYNTSYPSLPEGVETTVATIILPAGDWDVDGHICYNFEKSGMDDSELTQIIEGISFANNSLSGVIPITTCTRHEPITVVGLTTNRSVPTKRVNVTGSTPIYLVARYEAGDVNCLIYDALLRARKWGNNV